MLHVGYVMFELKPFPHQSNCTWSYQHRESSIIDSSQQPDIRHVLSPLMGDLHCGSRTFGDSNRHESHTPLRFGSLHIGFAVLPSLLVPPPRTHYMLLMVCALWSAVTSCLGTQRCCRFLLVHALIPVWCLATSGFSASLRTLRLLALAAASPQRATHLKLRFSLVSLSPPALVVAFFARTLWLPSIGIRSPPRAGVVCPRPFALPPSFGCSRASALIRSHKDHSLALRRCSPALD